MKPSPVPSSTGCKEGGEAQTGHLLFLTLELLREQPLLIKGQVRGGSPQEQEKVDSCARFNRKCSMQGPARVNDRPTSPDDDDCRRIMVTKAGTL